MNCDMDMPASQASKPNAEVRWLQRDVSRQSLYIRRWLTLSLTAPKIRRWAVASQWQRLPDTSTWRGSRSSSSPQDEFLSLYKRLPRRRITGLRKLAEWMSCSPHMVSHDYKLGAKVYSHTIWIYMSIRSTFLIAGLGLRLESCRL
jgi:hypothetical protein